MAEIQSPEERFGHVMGAERKLVRWADMLAWFRDVAVASDRVVTTSSAPQPRDNRSSC